MSLFSQLGSRIRGSGGHFATVDAAQAAPPPSPLAPIDLTDTGQVTGVMEIAARIGELLIASGSSNSDARAQVYLTAASYGLHYCHVDLVLNTITIHTNIGTGSNRRPITILRVASGISIDFRQLTEVDRLIRSIHSGATPPALAEKILDDIESMPTNRKTWQLLLGWGTMGGFMSIMLGGNLFVGTMSFLIAVLIMGVNTWLGRFRLPPFYQNVIGGFIAVVPAAIIYNLSAEMGLRFSPSQIIGMGIIVLVAGLTLVQCLVDGITRAPVTSSARFFEALLSTAAIIAGVAAGIRFSDLIGFPLPPLATIAPPVYHEIPLLVICGGIGSAAFAYANYAPWNQIIVSGLTASSAMVFYYFVVVPFGFGPIFASAMASVVVGLVGGLLARRYFIPPLVTMIVGYTPMLPGLTLYRGMYAMLNEQIMAGFANLAMAFATAGGLAAGVVFGERIARKMRSPRYFRPYSAFKRLGRYSFRRASRLAERAQRASRPATTGGQSPKPPRPQKKSPRTD